ncbi:TIGR04211 family SH3 domain-containing protein [Sulfuriflexus sp.]|uniref:TIGR04211 family SH3 domain-containing protein n=1 Tax=Sulfuriflexus sp. TaxID=2015443 RepID=UPI0028CF8DA2|nr:TIGR04211 family SH3 domain-containing protein [Sulfuriflexus sp.]MDT8403316.1 TIGR04211 family SH3 domain-containing protein [Sulfuriflexus sp.]
MNKWLISFILFLASAAVLADTRYVSDELTITVRSGPSNQHQIVKMIRSGARLNVIEEVVNNGKQYARVQAGEMKGWVLSQYLTPTPIARDQLEAAQDKTGKYRAENASLKKQLADQQQARIEVEKQREQFRQRAEQTAQELKSLKQASARPLELARNNEQLRQELATHLSEVQLLRQENADLKSRDEREWFIAGAAIVLISIIFGILLTRIRWQKRSSWGGGSL